MKINKIDIITLGGDISLGSIVTNSLEEFVDQLETNMQSALDKNAPEITKKIVARKKVPWLQIKLENRKNFQKKGEDLVKV